VEAGYAGDVDKPVAIGPGRVADRRAPIRDWDHRVY